MPGIDFVCHKASYIQQALQLTKLYMSIEDIPRYPHGWSQGFVFIDYEMCPRWQLILPTLLAPILLSDFSCNLDGGR